MTDTRSDSPATLLIVPGLRDHVAQHWGSALEDLGAVGHLNPASGYGPWPMALPLIGRLLR